MGVSRNPRVGMEPKHLRDFSWNKMIVQCLQMNSNQSVTLNTCTGENNQKWILGTPNNPTTEDLEAKEPLLLPPIYRRSISEQREYN